MRSNHPCFLSGGPYMYKKICFQRLVLQNSDEGSHVTTTLLHLSLQFHIAAVIIRLFISCWNIFLFSIPDGFYATECLVTCWLSSDSHI